jgi:hypothetical protein
LIIATRERKPLTLRSLEEPKIFEARLPIESIFTFRPCKIRNGRAVAQPAQFQSPGSFQQKMRGKDILATPASTFPRRC